MSYTPTEWKAGDTVTSAKLNKLEQGVASAGGGGGVLIATETDFTLDKTWKEVHDALAIGTIVVCLGSDETGAYLYIFGSAYVDQDIYYLGLVGSEKIVFTTDSENGYPVMAMPDHR